MDSNTGAQQDLSYRAARFNEKGYLEVWGGDTLKQLMVNGDCLLVKG